VHLYTQRFPRRQVAIKVLKVETLDRETRRQFVAEANVMAQLSTHPAIATIYGADVTADGQPYLIMEYCSGGSLGARYREQPLGVEEVLQIGVRIASALESAHRAGVIHHDVKPANILITDYGAPVLTDFGISIGDEVLSEATVFRTQHSSSASIEASGSGGSVGLSVPWAPPEAFDDHPEIDARSDVYSLGATLFSLLEGRSPFEVPGGANSPVHLSRRIDRGEITPGSAGVPDSLAEALARAMSVRPGRRPASALELGEALQAVQRERDEAVTPFDLVRVGQGEVQASADDDPHAGGEGETDVMAASIDEALVETRIRSSTQDTQRKPIVTGLLRSDGVASDADVPDNRIPSGQRRRPYRALIVGIAAAVLVIAGVATAIAFATANSEVPQAEPMRTTTPQATTASTPTPSARPEPLLASEVQICSDEYFSFLHEMSDFDQLYSSLEYFYEPIVLSTPGQPLCGYQSQNPKDVTVLGVSDVIHVIEFHNVPGLEDSLLAMLGDAGYSCADVSSLWMECAQNQHRVTVGDALFGSEIAEDTPLLEVSAYAECDSTTTCTW
jgi:serine/threonine protein kinase